MEFFTNYTKRPKEVKSYNSGELKVEVAGYLPAYKEIASMIISGQISAKSREDFQYPDDASIEKEVNHVDPFDKDEFEMIDVARDASRQLGIEIARAKAEKAEADKKKEIEAIKAELAAEQSTQPASGERAS